MGQNKHTAWKIDNGTNETKATQTTILEIELEIYNANKNGKVKEIFIPHNSEAIS